MGLVAEILSTRVVLGEWPISDFSCTERMCLCWLSEAPHHLTLREWVWDLAIP